MAINISIIIINSTKGKDWETVTKPSLVKLCKYGTDLIIA